MYYKSLIFIVVNSVVFLAHASEASGSKEPSLRLSGLPSSAGYGGPGEKATKLEDVVLDVKKVKLAALEHELDALHGDDKWEERRTKIMQAIEKDKVHPDEIRYGAYGSERAAADKWPLYEAVSYHDIDAVKFLFGHNAQVDVPVRHIGSLLFVAEKMAIAQLLLDHKADIESRNTVKWHEGILEYVTAVSSYEPELIPLYIKYGADPRTIDAHGNTLLHVLIEDCPLTADNLAICKQKARYLIAAGVSPDSRADTAGDSRKTVLELMQERRKPEKRTAIELLEYKIALAETDEKRQKNLELLQTIQKAWEEKRAEAVPASATT